MDWKSLFATRTTANTSSRALFDDIVANSVGRIDKIDRLIDGGNYDVKDQLLDAFDNAAGSPFHLAQKYELPITRAWTMLISCTGTGHTLH